MLFVFMLLFVRVIAFVEMPGPLGAFLYNEPAIQVSEGDISNPW